MSAFAGAAALARAQTTDATELSAEQVEALCNKAYASEAILLANIQSETANAEGNPWKLELERKELGLHVYSSATTGSPLRRFKAVCLLADITPAQLIEFIGDRAHRLTWDRNIFDLQMTRLRNDERGEAAILRSCTKKVGPIDGRDFLDATIVRTLADGSVINCGSGLEPEETCGLYPITKDFVRGFNLSGTGWHIQSEASNNGVKVSYIIQTDLKGWFTAFIINQAIAGSYVSFFDDLQRALKDRKTKS